MLAWTSYWVTTPYIPAIVFMGVIEAIVLFVWLQSATRASRERRGLEVDR